MAREPSLPFIVIQDDGSISIAHKLPLQFLKGHVTTTFTIFTREGQARPRRVIETRATGERVFGKDRLAVSFEWTTFEQYEVAALAAKLRAAIQADDDVFDQSRSHAEHLDAIDAASSFDELVAAMDPP